MFLMLFRYDDSALTAPCPWQVSGTQSIILETEMENQAVKFEFVGSKLLIAVDPNRDGGPVIKVEIDLMEIPDEVMSLISAKKALPAG
jgi:hypothetical protein